MDRETQQILHELISELPAQSAELIRATYFEGLTLQEAGQRLGISKAWASRLHARTLEQLGRSLRRLELVD
jgi:RNA polymerase sigma factor for flagellar operon FliA